MFIKITHKLRQWGRSLKGATAIEYSLLIAGIAMILTVAAFLLGDEIGTLFTDLVSGMQQ